MIRSHRALVRGLAVIPFLGACGASDFLPDEAPFDAAAWVDGGAGSTSSPDAAADASMPPEAAPPMDSGTKPEAAPHGDAAPDTGVPTTKSCKNAGGVLCTDARWLLCPAGFEPVAEGDGHFNCGMTNEGWCCQPAPPSSCSQSGAANCIPGTCSGCFDDAPDPSLTCEPGRSCCVDVCD